MADNPARPVNEPNPDETADAPHPDGHPEGFSPNSNDNVVPDPDASMQAVSGVDSQALGKTDTVAAAKETDKPDHADNPEG